MSRIKAIETRYKGCRFRSRLEARWAVFLDAMGIDWQYEPQGYVVDGTPYLPDFFVPAWGWFIEIKPTWEAVNDADMKIHSLVVGTQRPLLLVVGSVGLGEYGTAIYLPNPPEVTAIYHGFGEFSECGLCQNLCLLSSERSVGAFVHFAACVVDPRVTFTFVGGASDAINEAYIAARSARFEFGESGAPR